MGLGRSGYIDEDIALDDDWPPLPRQSALYSLEQILKGHTTFSQHQSDYLREMSSSVTTEYARHEHNPSVLKAPVFPLETTIVGNSYRNPQQQSALRNKNPGNRVLVVPEPGNGHDRAALAVLVARSISSNQFVWTHVGYIPREVAAELSKVWPRYKGRLLVGEGRLVGSPATKTNPRVMLEPNFRDYWKK